MQVSRGMKFTYAPNNPVGARLVGFEIGGKPVNPKRVYIISTIDFIASGMSFLALEPAFISEELRALAKVAMASCTHPARATSHSIR